MFAVPHIGNHQPPHLHPFNTYFIPQRIEIQMYRNNFFFLVLSGTGRVFNLLHPDICGLFHPKLQTVLVVYRNSSRNSDNRRDILYIETEGHTMETKKLIDLDSLAESGGTA